MTMKATLSILCPVFVSCMMAGCTTPWYLKNEQPPAKTKRGDIEEAYRILARDLSDEKIYLVMTSTGGTNACCDLVVRNVKEALSFYAGGDAVFVFFVRPRKTAERGLSSRFPVRELVELMYMPEDRARFKVAGHDWTLEEKPDFEKIWRDKESKATDESTP